MEATSMSWVGLAGILGYIAGLFSFRLKSRWCPVCGDIWDVVATEPTNPAPRYTFYTDRPGGYAGPTHARWVRRP